LFSNAIAFLMRRKCGGVLTFPDSCGEDAMFGSPKSCGPTVKVVPLVVGVMMTVYSAAISAAEWSAEPSASVQLFYDDNIRLTATGQDGVWGTVITPELKLAQRTEISEIALSGNLKFRHFSGEDQLDSNDQQVRLNSHRLTERGRWQFDAGIDRDSTITSELEDTGLVQTRRRRESVNLNPSWTHALSDQSDLKLAYAFTHVSYDGGTSYVDYRYHDLSGTVVHQLDAKNQLSVTLSASRYSAPNIKSETDTYGLQAGVIHAFSETVRGSLLVGGRKSEAETETAGRSSGTGALLYAALEKELERTSFTGTLSKTVSPSGSGQLNESDRLAVKMHRELTAMMDFSLEVSGIRNKSGTGGVSSTDRKYYSILPSLHWRVSRWWRVAASYRYMRQKYDNSTTAAESNRAMVSVAYTWPKMAVSR